LPAAPASSGIISAIFLDVTQNSRQVAISRAVAVSMFASLFEHWRMLQLAVGPLLDIQTPAGLLVGAWCWLLLLLTTAWGLATGRRWGAYLLFALVPITTVAWSIPLIPMVTKLFPEALRPYALTVVNTLVLLAAPLILRRAGSPPQPVAQVI
jgi:hypothetical protein